MPAVKSILFVCLGNICRSPAAEAVLKCKLVRGNSISSIRVESAGTSHWHVGSMPDPRMIEHGQRRGYIFDSLARQFKRSDLNEFDLIVPMDKKNLIDIENGFSMSPNYQKKLRPFMSFVDKKKWPNLTGVPDPYYGGEEQFELVLDIVENGCESIIDQFNL